MRAGSSTSSPTVDRLPGRRPDRASCCNAALVLVILAVAALAYALQRSWKLALFVVLAFLLITNLGYWEATVQTISLVGFSTITSVAIGVPLGIAARTGRGSIRRCGRCSI